MKLFILLFILLSSVRTLATPAECKLSFYNFNKAHESRVQAVGVDEGGSITLGFRHDVNANLQEQADMASLIRACVSSGMMSRALYKFKKDDKVPHTICTNLNAITLGMVCLPYKCEGPKGKSCAPPRLIKGDADGNPIEVK